MFAAHVGHYLSIFHLSYPRVEGVSGFLQNNEVVKYLEHQYHSIKISSPSRIKAEIMLPPSLASFTSLDPEPALLEAPFLAKSLTITTLMATPSVPCVLSEFTTFEALVSLCHTVSTMPNLTHLGVKILPVGRLDLVVKSSMVD